MLKPSRVGGDPNAQPFNMLTGTVKQSTRHVLKPNAQSSCSCTKFVVGTLALGSAALAAAYNWKNQIAQQLPENLAGTFLEKMDLVGQIPGFVQKGFEDVANGDLSSPNAQVAVGATALSLLTLIACAAKKYICPTLPKAKLG